MIESQSNKNFGIVPKNLLTTKQMYSICRLKFGVINSVVTTEEFGDAKQYAEGCRQGKLTINTDTREQFGIRTKI